MANVLHSSLTGAELHEPKGIAAAEAGKVYVADGAGSGSFEDQVTSYSFDIWAQKTGSGTTKITDTLYWFPPFSGEVVSISATIESTTSSSLETVTVSVHTGSGNVYSRSRTSTGNWRSLVENGDSGWNDAYKNITKGAQCYVKADTTNIYLGTTTFIKVRISVTMKRTS